MKEFLANHELVKEYAPVHAEIQSDHGVVTSKANDEAYPKVTLKLKFK